MTILTISYRREDSLDIAGRIHDKLAVRYGEHSIFRDIDNIRPGIDFRKQISATLDQSELLIVLIGPNFIGRTDKGDRISGETDFVRFEVETALKKPMPVIPVLVGGAAMPQSSELPESIRELAYLHAVTVSSSEDFNHHVERLTRAIDGVLGPAVASATKLRAVASPGVPRDVPGKPGSAATTPSGGEAARRWMMSVLAAGAAFALLMHAVLRLKDSYQLWHYWSIAVAAASVIVAWGLFRNRTWSMKGLFLLCALSGGFLLYWTTSRPVSVTQGFQFYFWLLAVTFLSGVYFLVWAWIANRRRGRTKRST